jgi:hypothetical protein
VITPAPSKGQRSRKDLACTAAATAHQREFVADLKRRVIDNGEPFAIAQADTPHEIFHTMDIPLISNQWWSAYISAKQLSPRYFEVLDKLGYPSNSCRYCSLGLACTLDNAIRRPRPGADFPNPRCWWPTSHLRMHSPRLWPMGQALGSEFFPLEAPGWTHKDPDWFTQVECASGKSSTEPRRIELLVQEMRALIELLEVRTGRRFDDEKFVALMHAINEQEGYIAEAARLIGNTRPCPVSIADQMPNTMIPQWHRRLGGGRYSMRGGSATRSPTVCARRCWRAQRRVRLMWIGAGLWHDHGLLQCSRRSSWRGLRVVDVHAICRPQYIPRASRSAHARSGQPRVLHERGVASSSLDEQLDGQ